jgi:hypothetical protein
MPRNQNRTPVSIKIILEWSSGKREARISDISLGGCFIDYMTPVNKGEQVAFQVKIPDGEWLALTGEVVYVFSGVGFGVRFAPLSESDRIILEHLIIISGGNPWGGD